MTPRLAHQDPADVAAYKRAGWWGETTVGEMVAQWAVEQPDAVAYVADDVRASWSEYDARANRLASALVGTGLPRGARVAVLLPDGVAVHVAFIAAERAGVTIVGLGHRAGDAEIRHILGKTGAQGIVTLAEHRGRPTAELVDALRADGLPVAHHVVVDADASGDITVNGDARVRRARSTSAAARTAPTISSSSTRRRAPPACRSACCTTRTGGSSSTSSRRPRAR